MAKAGLNADLLAAYLCTACCLFLFGFPAVAVTYESGLTAEQFQGSSKVLQLQCTGRTLPPEADLMSLVLYRAPPPTHGGSPPTPRVLSILNLRKRQCSTGSELVACHLSEADTRLSAVRALVVVDLLEEGQQPELLYACNVSMLSPDGRVDVASWTLPVSLNRTTTSSTTTTTTTAPTTNRPSPNGDSPVASGVKSNVQEFQLPISVVIIGLVLLLFFAILCAILVILQCRGKRRRRSRAANRESLLSQKNEPVGGEGGYRTTRTLGGYPPGHMPPETPGGNFAMRYQKSIPDTGYVSGSSVYYSEPYGTLDEEIKERLRPNPRMCHIPYDIKGGALDPHPQEHSA